LGFTSSVVPISGYPVDRRGQEFHSLLRAYLFERECYSVSLEDMLRKQIHNMDQFRQLMDLATKRISTGDDG
jgi:hypothetical protein